HRREVLTEDHLRVGDGGGLEQDLRPRLPLFGDGPHREQHTRDHRGAAADVEELLEHLVRVLRPVPERVGVEEHAVDEEHGRDDDVAGQAVQVGAEVPARDQQGPAHAATSPPARPRKISSSSSSGDSTSRIPKPSPTTAATISSRASARMSISAEAWLGSQARLATCSTSGWRSRKAKKASRSPRTV